MAEDNDALLRESLAMLEKHHVVLALTTGTVERVTMSGLASATTPENKAAPRGSLGVNRGNRKRSISSGRLSRSAEACAWAVPAHIEAGRPPRK